MKRYLIIGLLSVLFYTSVYSQSIGVSYFFPKNGYFSNPIAPISFSVPLQFNQYFQISMGIQMNNIGGMSMTGFPDNYDSQRPLIGPFQSVEINLIPTIKIPMGKSVRIDLMGGVYAFSTFNCKLISGNFDEMLLETYNLQAVNSDFLVKKSPLGWGYVTGVRLNFKLSGKLMLYTGANYYLGSQIMEFSGSFLGFDQDNNPALHEKNYTDLSLLYHGLSISLGVVIN
jgi:hypothetical protein